MALRDFDRVRERRQIRVDGPTAASIASIVALAIGGAWFHGRHEGRRLGRQEAERDAKRPPMPTGPAFGVAPLAFAAPSPSMPTSAEPVLPRRLPGHLAPDLRELAGGTAPGTAVTGLAEGSVAGAVEVARARSDDSVAEGEDLQLAIEAAAEREQDANKEPAVDAAAASTALAPAAAPTAPAPPAIAAPAAAIAAPVRRASSEVQWSEAALRSEPALAPTSHGSFESEDGICAAADVHWPMTSDGRPLTCDPDHVGGACVEDDLRARTSAELDRHAFETMGRAAPSEPTADATTAGAGADGAVEPAALPAASTATALRSAAHPTAHKRHVDDRTWYVQVKSLRSEAEAVAFSAQMRSEGYPPSVHRAEIADQGVFYRIRLGPYATAERAHAVQARLLRATGHDGMVMSSRAD